MGVGAYMFSSIISVPTLEPCCPVLYHFYFTLFTEFYERINDDDLSRTYMTCSL